MLTRRDGAKAALGLALAIPALGSARGQGRSLRFGLDWAISGSNAFGPAALRAGFFAEEGLQVRLSRGFGSGRAPVDVAAGTQDMGFGDLSAMTKFVAENPSAGLICVLMVYDGLPLVCISRADGPIRTPKDLEGKRLAAPEGDAGRQIFPVFADAAGFDARAVNWISVSPELREPMLVRGQADAITGFVSSTSISLQGLGMPLAQQRLFRYRDYGVPLYSNGLITTRRYAEANPDIVRGMVRALIRGTRLMVQDPAAAILAVKEMEPLADVPLETQRARMVAEEMIMTDHVRRNGLSAVDPARLARSIEVLEKVYAFPRRPTPAEIYTDAYLPATAAERAMA